jgi:hypothetical protein
MPSSVGVIGSPGSRLAHDDVGVGARDDRAQLGLLRRGDLKLVEGLLEIVGESLPLLETRERDFVVRVVDGGIGVEAGVDHDAIDEVVDYRRDAVDTAETLVQGGCDRWG